MSFVKAKDYIEKWNFGDRVMEFSVSSATVKDAAIAVGSSEAEIAKTLSFMVLDQPILIVMAGDQKIDNSKYKSMFHTKAKMLSFEDVEKVIGHQVGGVCPFGINEGVLVYLDISLKRFDFVYPACGSGNSAVKLTIEELEKISNFECWIDVCKSIE